jgi:hypothetical protein
MMHELFLRTTTRRQPVQDWCKKERPEKSCAGNGSLLPHEICRPVLRTTFLHQKFKEVSFSPVQLQSVQFCKETGRSDSTTSTLELRLTRQVSQILELGQACEKEDPSTHPTCMPMILSPRTISRLQLWRALSFKAFCDETFKPNTSKPHCPHHVRIFTAYSGGLN